MYLKTFEDMQKTSVFFMLKPVNAVYGFIVTVCAAIAAALIWAFFAPMDDVVKASVLLRPSKTVSSVKCVTSGQLYSKNFENDDDVIEGQLLFSLDTTVYQAEKESYLIEKEKNKEQFFIYKTLEQTIATDKIEGIAENTDAFLTSKLYLTEKSRYEKILEDSKVKYEREKNAPFELKVPWTIEDLENQYMQTKLTYETWLNNQKIQTKEKIKSLETAEKNINNRITELERTIRNSTIYSPISGRVSEITELNIGDYLLAGEEILRIVPQNEEKLKADIYIDPSYVARVKVGNAVKIKFPGLPPSRYGMIETEVSLVPPDATSLNGSLVFVAEAEIENPYLTAKNGQTARLLPGITAEGRVITDRSTVMQMILRKLDFVN